MQLFHYAKMSATLLLLGVAGCASNIEQESQQAFSLPSHQPTKLSNDQFAFTEGPAWDGSNIIYFSDLNFTDDSLATTHKFHIDTGEFTQFIRPSMQANGLMFDREHKLMAARHQTGDVVKIDTQSKAVEVISGQYQGKRFNQPNDLVMDKSGGIYFTDPTWNPEQPQDARAVYYINAEGVLQRIIDDTDKPNGIILSLDETTLYITDTDSFDVRSYPVLAPGKLDALTLFAKLERKEGYTGTNSGADGMAIDRNGNLFVTTATGVQVFNDKGKAIGVIKLPEAPTNCTFAGQDLDTLYITAQKNLYSIKLNTTGIYFPQ